MSKWSFRVRGYHPLLRDFPDASTNFISFGCSPFARRYLGNLGWFLFLGVLRCFSSPGSLQYPMYSDIDDLFIQIGFPHSEIRGSKFVWKLSAAYRILQRPSSPLIAKAFTVCAYSLDHITRIRLRIGHMCQLTFSLFSAWELIYFLVTSLACRVHFLNSFETFLVFFFSALTNTCL